MIKRIEPDAPWWAVSVEQVAQDIGSSPNGLSGVEATTRLQRYGTNTLRDKDDSGVTRLLLRQLSSPIVLILIAAAILSFIMHDATDGLIILFIVIVSGLLGFWQEYRAASVMASLQQLVAVQAEVLRDGVICKISLEDIVPGDVAILSAGSNVPADCRLLEARDLFVNEATLTGNPSRSRRCQVIYQQTRRWRAAAIFYSKAHMWLAV